MGTQSRTSFKKRQKELARQEKQRDKTARRLERKHAPKSTSVDAADADAPEMLADTVAPPSDSKDV
jgi:hypothetical protein